MMGFHLMSMSCIHTSLELLFLKRHKLRARSKINIALAAGSVVACSLDDNESVIKCSDKLIYIYTYIWSVSEKKKFCENDFTK